VIELIFTIRRKDPLRQLDAELRHRALRQRPAAGRPRDPATVDLWDGRSDADRGGPAMVTKETLARARRDHPGSDIDALEAEWRQAERGRAPPRDPDGAFLAWLALPPDLRRL
jgi:hypothetical protein